MKKLFIFAFIFVFCISVCAKEKEYVSIDYQEGITVIGNLVEYVNLYSDYIDDGASFYDENGNDLSSMIKIVYHNHGTQVSKIDTRFNDNYLVTYSIKYNGNVYKASRVVVISDTEAPVFNELETEEITDLEVASFDVNEGVIATDNSSKVKVLCDNSIGMIPGSYFVLCRAKDESGNISSKRRLIKVVKGISFDYDDSLTIVFPKGNNYIYKYSLDGKTFTECKRKEILNISSGSVIAAVYLGDELVTSNTFLIN